MALSTPRIDSRGCRQPCTDIGFLLDESRPRVLLTSLSAVATYEDALRSGPPSPVSPHRIQSSRGSSTPAAARETGSRESETSTRHTLPVVPLLAQAAKTRGSSTGRSRATQFHERPPRKTATKYRIKFRNSARLELHGGAVLESFQPLPMRPVSSFPGFRERAIIAVSIFAFCSPTTRFSSSVEELSRDQSWMSWMELKSDAVAQFPARYTSDCPPEWNHNRWSITGRTVSESFTDTLAPATLPP